ncbi:unnamed protein product [Allacma fusca]|uniref:C2H2-type domain-containing protein n=1 Tax=Allacma fusca TaxID=39272 RepID=A0A8J2J6H4_9HEXA|nr:unnamed protein product [Allacma fusca]
MDCKLNLCVLCGYAICDLTEINNEEVNLDSALILKNTFRVLKINESYPVLDEETGLVITLSQFCSLCLDRAQTLNKLFTQIDALHDHVTQIREDMEREFSVGNFGGNVESQGSSNMTALNSKLRSFICEKIINRQFPSTEHSGPQETPHDDYNFCGDDNHFSDSGLPQDTKQWTDLVEDKPTVSTTNSLEGPDQQENKKTPKKASSLLDTFVLVKRLSLQEIDKYTKKGRSSKRKRTPIISERKTKKLQLELEVKQNQFFCTVESCTRKTGFSTQILLECHVAKKHEGLTHPYTCKECGRKFRQPKIYEMHLKTHQGDYPFFCQYCGVGFLNSWTLGVHSVRHTGEMPYKCHLCPKAYKGHNGLKYHIRMTHTKEKPYTCDSCGKNFAQMDKLKRHIHAVHETERPWVCDLCGKTFAVSNYLYMHRRSVHDGHSFNKARSRKQQDESEAPPEGVAATVPEVLPNSTQSSATVDKS